MNTKYILLMVMLSVLALLTSCNPNNKNDHNNHGHDHDSHTLHNEANHDSEPHNHGSVSYTHIEQGYEVFIESSYMIVRENVSFTIHITNLKNYKPLINEHISIKLIGEKTYSAEAHAHDAGIYHAELKPKQTGLYKLSVSIKNKDIKLNIDSVMVYLNHNRIPESIEENAEFINYLKEQAWNTDFNIYKLQAKPFARVIKTSGEIMPAPGDETIITALHSGTISLKNLLLEGKRVKNGDVLGSISSDLIHQNLTNDYLEAKNTYEKANIDFKRVQKLIDEKLISEKEYLEAKLNFESAKNTYNNISKFYSKGKDNVKAPIDGFVRSVFVNEGQFIEEGQPIATIIQNKKIVLKANVPQQYNHLASGFFSANFSPVYSNELFSTDKFNGKRISYSSALPANSLFTSVNFELDASDKIMSGSYCEVYLKSASVSNTIAVPISSLMEDQGNYYVFRMIDGEHYKKQYVKLGNSDGEFVEITDGLNEKDVVVSKGTYKIHLASLGTAAPTHTHSH